LATLPTIITAVFRSREISRNGEHRPKLQQQRFAVSIDLFIGLWVAASPWRHVRSNTFAVVPGDDMCFWSGNPHRLLYVSN